ncbi:MAG: prepilin peptidase [Patescibacteria group bacterium]
MLLYLFIIGLSIGSFLNVLIDRLSNDESIWGRSHCDNCKKQLKSIDLVPIFSYLTLKGKCRYCNKKINIQYPIVELLTGILFVVAFIYLPALSLTVRILQLALISALIVIFFADLKYHIIPDQMLIAAGLVGLIIFAFQGNNPSLILFRFVEGLLVSLPIYLIYAISSGRAMGFGDVKLAYVLGLIFGVQKGLVALYIAFVLGAIVGLYLILSKKKKLKSKIAFGPFIILGSFLVLFIDKAKLFMILFFSN